MKPIHLFSGLLSITLIGIIGVVLYVDSITNTGMPSLEQLQNPDQNVASVVMSDDGHVIDNFYIQRRIALPYDSIPKNFFNALIATEDRAFWDHWGVHSMRVAKAFVKNLLAGRIKEGASTITMQLARNMFLNQENTLTRKIREAATAVQIEKAYTKEDVLRMYANTVLFGRGAYGIQVAAQTYFGKNASQLTVSECAMLVGILPRPSRYNPIRNYDLAIKRRDLVLGLMHEQNFISDAKYRQALREKPAIANSSPENANTYQAGESIAPHFVEMIRQNFGENRSMRQYNLYRDGLVVHTTLNSKIQKYANEAAIEHLEELQKQFDRRWNWNYHKDVLQKIISESIRENKKYRNAPKNDKSRIADQLRNDKDFIDSVKNLATTVQCGVVVIDPFTGSMLAMVGASPKFMKEYSASQYSLNHTTQIKRQPGSAFKPFVYTSTLKNGLTPEDTAECGPFSYELITGDIWSPRGTGDCDSGQHVTLYDGLRRSINTVAARLITGPTNPHEVIATARKMGVSANLMAVPAVALGAGGDVRPVEMVSAYGTFAYNGIDVEPCAVKYSEDRHGNIVQSRQRSLNVTNAFPKAIGIQMTHMMEAVVNAGTARRIRNTFKKIDAAGKTGTTNDAADAWFVGFTPQLVAGVWIGFDDRRITMNNMDYLGYGGHAAAPLWAKLMKKIYDDPELPYEQKQFSYKNPPDSTYKYGLPYPLTEKQESYQLDKYIKILENINKDSLKIEQSRGAELPPFPLD